MGQPVALDNVEHHDLRIITRHEAALGDGVNQVLVVPTEFAELQRDYPIFFRRNATGGLESFVLLGLDKDENLFLEAPAWNARAVPALQLRGPFRIGTRTNEDGSRELITFVDLDHPRISREQGEPLFLTHGGNAPALERALRALKVLQAGIDINEAMFAAFSEAGLLVSVNIDLKLDEATTYNLPDMITISAEALDALDGHALHKLHIKGFLALAFHVVSSMGNLSRIVELKNRRRAATL